MNNIMRSQYRPLEPSEHLQIEKIKELGLGFWELCDKIGQSREMSLAKTHIEDAVMRAVRHVTDINKTPTVGLEEPIDPAV
jgi:hypothetical protein